MAENQKNIEALENKVDSRFKKYDEQFAALEAKLRVQEETAVRLSSNVSDAGSTSTRWGLITGTTGVRATYRGIILG